jgi:flagellar biosynthesis/type III secretory pathway protein FliH
MTDVFELHLVELPKIEEEDSFSEARPEVGRWARFLGAKTDEERRKVSEEDPMVREAYDLLVELSSSEDVQRYAKEREENRKLNDIEFMLTREEGKEEGWKLGRKKGQEEGKEEGQKEGEETGRKKGKREDIQRLLSLRSIELTPSDHDALMACNDITTLDKLLERALLIQPGERLFEGES